MSGAIHVDEKLARGLTMVEMRAILKGGREAGATSVRTESHPVRAAFKPVAFRYATRRRPDAGFVARMVERFDAFYGASPATLFRQAETLPEVDGVVGHTRRYLMLIPASADPECRSLLASCVCLDVRHSCVMLTQMPLAEVDLHAFERFHLRTRSGLVRDAMASFGAALLRDVGLYRTMAAMSAGLPGKAFAMPFADGLLLGHASALHPGAIRPHGTVNFFGDEPIRFDAFPMGGENACRIATFVGPQEMRPAQVALRDGLLDIAARRAEHLLDQANVITYLPGLLDKASDYAGSYEDRLARQIREFERDMRDLLERPGMMEALGRPILREPDAAPPRVRYRFRSDRGPSGPVPR